MCSCNVAALSRWSAGQLYQLISRRMASAGVYDTFPSRLPRYSSPAGLNLESMGPQTGGHSVIVLNEPGTVRL